MSTASARIRRRISVVKVPTPGPYSMKTRARAQSTSLSTLLTRKRELGIRLPSILGCLIKLRPKSRICSEREVRCAGTVRDLPFTMSSPPTCRAPDNAGAGWWGVRNRLKLLPSCGGVASSPVRRALHVALFHRGIDVDRSICGHDRGVLGGTGGHGGV